MTTLEERIAELAEAYKPLAVQILKEAIRVPADHVDTDDPRCGLSNHERPRLEYLKRMIIEHKAVERPEDVFFDGFGMLVWTVRDEGDGVPPEKKRVVYFDGHTDTVNALRKAWRERIGEGMDAYDGLLNPDACSVEFLTKELGYIPPKDEWHHLVFGRGGADQLAGVVDTLVATKIMVELKHLGSLKGAVVWAYGTVAEEDNDGGGPMYLMRHELPKAPVDRIPDVVIFTEGTSDSGKGPLGIYRGQRGRMQIEVDVGGKSCHGSMPWEGLNPLEYGAAILVEATQRCQDKEGFKSDSFLGGGTRTASWANLDTPSDCAVPERFTFRFDRRITVGESPDACVADIENLESVKRARKAGLVVTVRIPIYPDKTWKGFQLNNPQVYMGWVTPADHPSIQAAVNAYRKVVTPRLPKDLKETKNSWHKEPRVDRWVFSTDGVGFPIREDDTSILYVEGKRWIHTGGFKHPAMLGLGAGYEQNTHKIGECVDSREMVHAIAFYAAYPSHYVALTHQ